MVIFNSYFDITRGKNEGSAVEIILGEFGPGLQGLGLLVSGLLLYFTQYPGGVCALGALGARRWQTSTASLGRSKKPRLPSGYVKIAIENGDL